MSENDKKISELEEKVERQRIQIAALIDQQIKMRSTLAVYKQNAPKLNFIKVIETDLDTLDGDIRITRHHLQELKKYALKEE